jgi:hypothetical protein
VRERSLQVLMPVALAWGLAVALAEALDLLWTRMRIAEGSPLHGVVEEAGTPIFVLALCAIAAVLVYGRWPGFLRVPPSIPAGALLVRLVAFTVLSTVGIAIVVGVAWYFLVLSREDPSHSQYGLSLLFAVMFYPVMIAPATAVLATWLWARRAAGQGER